MPEVITDHLDLWTSALLTKSTPGRGSNGKQEAYGIKKLRELILDLAVRGRLVPQDANDEPASELLKRIAVEKARLIAEGRVKEGKPLSAISEEEKTCQLPQSWEWSRIADLTSVLNGRAYSKQELLASGTPVLRVGNLFTSNDWYYSNLELEQDKYCDAGDLIFAWSASFGPFIWAGPKVIYHYHIWKLNLHSEADLNKNYLYKFLLEKTQEMKASGHGVSMIHMTKEAMEKMVVPVPPLAEQHRIVAKVDELMALCDQLEKQQTDSLAAHQTLVETLLGTLTRPASSQELAEAWARIASHFDTLFTTEASIDQLKQTILQLAVMGKLVPQDPNDEPADLYLKRVAEEKQRLIEAKEILKPKKLPSIDNDDIPFQLPNGWQWAYVWDVAKLITSGSRDWAKYYSNTGAIFVTMGNLSRGDYKLRLDSLRYVNPPVDGEGSRTRLEAKDLLISITGDVGNLGLIPEEFGEAYINQHTCLLRFMPDCQSRYFPELMRSPWAKYQFDAPQRGVKNSFRLSDVGEMLIPVPPAAEQHRIVAKVDELMALCDALKARIADAQTIQLHLADAIVEQAVA